MSGSNGVLKFQEVNRDDQIVNIKTRGATFNTESFFLVTGASVLAQNIIFNTLSLTNVTPNLITLDTLKNITDLYNRNNTLEVGSAFNITVNNTDPLNIKTLVLPAGVTFNDTGSVNIAVPPNTRFVLKWIYNNLSSAVVYLEDFTGAALILGQKQGSAHYQFDSSSATLVDAGVDAVEQALWLRGTQVDPINIFRDTGSHANTAPVILTVPLTGLISKVNTNTSTTAGTVVTGAEIRYQIINATDTVTIAATLTSSTFSPMPIPPIDVTASTLVTTTNQVSPIKPISPGQAILERLTLVTPVQLTDLTTLSLVLTVPTGGFPATAVYVSVWDVVVYFSYQLSV